MDQSDRGVSGKLTLDRVVENALREIERLGYSRRSQNRYRAIWTHLIEFCNQMKSEEQFSGRVAAQFVEEYATEGVDHPGEGWRRHIACGVKVLAEFAQHGRIERTRMDLGKVHLLPPMQKALHEYEQYCRDRLHLRPTTLENADQRTDDLFGFYKQEESETPGPNPGTGSVGILVFAQLLEAAHNRAHCFGCALLPSVPNHAWDTAKGSQCRTANHPCSQGWPYPVGVGSRSHRPAPRGCRAQFGQRQTRLRDSLDGMPVGIACWRYPHTETGSSPLGRFQNRDHAIENRHATQPASDRRDRRSVN